MAVLSWQPEVGLMKVRNVMDVVHQFTSVTPTMHQPTQESETSSMPTSLPHRPILNSCFGGFFTNLVISGVTGKIVKTSSTRPGARICRGPPCYDLGGGCDASTAFHCCLGSIFDPFFRSSQTAKVVPRRCRRWSGRPAALRSA